MKKVLSKVLAIILVFGLFSCGKKETKVGDKTFDISKNYTICINSSADGVEFDSMRKGFVVGLKDLGLVEDINVTYHYANAEGNRNYADQIVDVFKEKNPDIYVTIGNTSTEATVDAIKDKPIVFLGVGNAEKLGYFDAEGNPVSNVTGVIDSQLVEEHLDFIVKNYTDKKRIGVIYTAQNAVAQYIINYLKFNATGLGIDIYTVSINKDEDIEKALDGIMPKVDALTLVPDYIVDRNLSKIIQRSKSEGKPIFGSTSKHKNAGVEVPIIRDYTLVGEEGARQVKEILVDGKKISDVKAVTVNFKVN